MNVPTWMAETGSLFDPSLTLITIYNHLKRWIKLNLHSDENILIELGRSECWPRQGVTREIEV
jgi:hypothetical protein